MLPHYVEAAKLTVQIGLIGVAGSLNVGLVLAFIRVEKVPVLKWNHPGNISNFREIRRF